MLIKIPIHLVEITVLGNVKIATPIDVKNVNGIETGETEQIEVTEAIEAIEVTGVIEDDENLSLNAHQDAIGTGESESATAGISSMTGRDVAIVNRERNEEVLRHLERRSQLLI